jgi:hypothetical protein
LNDRGTVHNIPLSFNSKNHQSLRSLFGIRSCAKYNA